MDGNREENQSIKIRWFADYDNRAVRLTAERLNHILQHPEMENMVQAIEETLASPVFVRQSPSVPSQTCTIGITPKRWLDPSGCASL